MTTLSPRDTGQCPETFVGVRTLDRSDAASSGWRTRLCLNALPCTAQDPPSRSEESWAQTSPGPLLRSPAKPVVGTHVMFAEGAHHTKCCELLAAHHLPRAGPSVGPALSGIFPLPTRL